MRSSVGSQKPAVYAAFFGTFIEWYDVVIAGIAASTVWPVVFFAKFSPAVSFMLSMLSYTAMYFARPLAALIFGHMGDRIGRKASLIYTLLTVGVAMFSIALLPPYSEIGLLAPILLLALRFVQGFGIGGEWQGAVSWIYENTENRKGLWTSLMQAANPIGFGLGPLVFMLVEEELNRSAFLSYGWRIPFIIGGAVVVAGIVLRLRMSESVEFNAAKKDGRILEMPSLHVWKSFPYFIALGILVSAFPTAAANLLLNPLGLAYMKALGIPYWVEMSSAILAGFVGFPFVLLGGIMYDKFRRMHLPIITGAAGIIVLSGFYFLIIQTKVALYIILAAVSVFAFLYISFGALGIILCKVFPVNVRYSGIGWTLQIATLITGVLLSFAVPAFVKVSGGLVKAWPYISLSVALLSALGSLSVLALEKSSR